GYEISHEISPRLNTRVFLIAYFYCSAGFFTCVMEMDTECEARVAGAELTRPPKSASNQRTLALMGVRKSCHGSRRCSIRQCVLECGDSSPLSLTATCCGALERADKSAREKAEASCRTPKLRTPGPVS